ncbi:ABC transporter permease [Spirillospora sp. NPDC048911]|uniref:ABC transporter permease n=1 Tax=Spirillospora sp. NPDC048911 TaxID=3364527 RepID=UPI00371E2252
MKGRRHDQRLGDWSELRDSPFLPAVVVVLIVSAAAGFFAGSYTYAMAAPAPKSIPAAVVNSPDAAKQQEFLAVMNKALGSSLRLAPYESYEEARHALDSQDVLAVVNLGDGRRTTLEVSGASGAQVAELLSKAAPEVGRSVGNMIVVHDRHPLQRSDPRGLTVFYICLAAMIMGFMGAVQLNTHASRLSFGSRVWFTVAYALLGGFAICAAVDWALHALELPFAESWLILALAMFTSGMVFTMFDALVGRWAIIPTWAIMVLVGNPSSGGPVPWPLQPQWIARLGHWLPPGATVSAQHTAIYFSGHQHLLPFVVLAAWACVGFAVSWHKARPSPPREDATERGEEQA